MLRILNQKAFCGPHSGSIVKRVHNANYTTVVLTNIQRLHPEIPAPRKKRHRAKNPQWHSRLAMVLSQSLPRPQATLPQPRESQFRRSWAQSPAPPMLFRQPKHHRLLVEGHPVFRNREPITQNDKRPRNRHLQMISSCPPRVWSLYQMPPPSPRAS